MSYKKIGILGFIVVLLITGTATLWPKDYKYILENECPPETCNYVFLDYEKDIKLEALTRGQGVDYLRWKFDIDEFVLYSGRYIGLRSDWIVEYYKTYGTDEWVRLFRKPSLIKISYTAETDIIIVVKETPYYATASKSGTGGILKETAIITGRSSIINFPERYFVEWIPSEQRMNYEHKLTWRIRDAESLWNTPTGILENIDSISFAYNMKVTWKDAMEQFDYAFYEPDKEELQVHFKEVEGSQSLQVRAFDPPIPTITFREWVPGVQRLSLHFVDESGTNVYDSSERSHNGTLYNGTQACAGNSTWNSTCPQWTTGQIGDGVILDGSNDFLSVTDHDDFTFSGGSDSAFSLEAWIKMDDATGFPIISKGVYNSNAEWRLLVLASDDKIYFQAFDESEADCYIGRSYDASNLTSYEGIWTHIVGTYNGSADNYGFKIYVNGIRLDDTNASNNPDSYAAMENLASNVHAGRDSTTYANGSFDEIRIYNRELSGAEINSSYGHGIEQKWADRWSGTPPNATRWAHGSVPVKVHSDANDTLWMNCNETNVTLTNDTLMLCNFSTPGWHNVTIYANHTTGGLATSTRHFHLFGVEPIPVSILAAIIAAAAVIGTAGAVVYKRRRR